MTFEDLLSRAASAPFGIAVICHSPEAADTCRQKLYLARAEAKEKGDLSYESLSISFSPHSERTLFVYKKEPNGKAEDGQGDDPIA